MRKADATYKLSNPEKVKKSYIKSNTIYRQSNPEQVKESLKKANVTYHQLNPERIRKSQKSKYIKRKLVENRSETAVLRCKKFKNEHNSTDRNPCDEDAKPKSQLLTMSEAIKLFHKKH